MSWRIATYLPLLAMVGCQFATHSVVVDTFVEGWQRAVILSVESRDTARVQDLSLMLRYHPDMMAEESLKLHVVTTTPSESRIAEQITVPLNLDLESRSSRGVELLEVPYRTSVKWREMGEYQIAIYPTKPTDGVESVGLIIK